MESDDDDLDFLQMQPWARATTCPARCVQADEDLMFAFDEDFNEEVGAGSGAAAAAADDDDDDCREGISRGTSSTLSGLFFLDE